MVLRKYKEIFTRQRGWLLEWACSEQSDFGYKVSVLGSKLKWEGEVENSRKGSMPDPCRGQKCPYGADNVVHTL